MSYSFFLCHMAHERLTTRKFYFQLVKLRRNVSLVARYSLKFSRYSLLVVKSLLTCCKIRSLLVAEVAHCKKLLLTRCRLRSLLVVEVARCKKSVVTRCKIRSLLVAEVARYKNSLVTRCKICFLLAATSHLLLNAKNYSSHVKTTTSP